MTKVQHFLKEITWFSWKPNKDLIALAVSWLMVVAALSSATYLATAQNGGLYFILYALVTATLFGVGIPLVWTVFIRKRSVASLGLTTKNLNFSLGVQIVLAVLLYGAALSNILSISLESLLPLMALALAIGFFEAVFWRGWVFLRLEEAFGLIPAILLGSLLYAAYHIGYGMPLSEMVFLFFIVIMFIVVFRLTKSIFILWPIFQPVGQLMTLVKDQLSLPLIAVVGFLEALVVMLVLSWLVTVIAKKRGIALAS